MKNSEYFRKADIFLLLAMLFLGVASLFAVKFLTPHSNMVEQPAVIRLVAVIRLEISMGSRLILIFLVVDLMIF